MRDHSISLYNSEFLSTSSVTFGDSFPSKGKPFGWLFPHNLLYRTCFRLPCVKGGGLKSRRDCRFPMLVTCDDSLRTDQPLRRSAPAPLTQGSLLVGFSHTICFTGLAFASLVQREVPRRGGGIAVSLSGYRDRLVESDQQSLRAFGPPSGPLAGRACSTLWLKMCHWHIFLTRRAHYTREPFGLTFLIQSPPTNTTSE